MRLMVSALVACILVAAVPPTQHDAQHDFDFEFGVWRAHLKRLVHPLSGSRQWTFYEGSSTVRKVWNGRANLGEFDVRGPAGRIYGLSLRLYNPQSRQWSIYWANAKDGSLSSPLIGAFHNGLGEFMDHENFNGRPILARFLFTNFTPRSFQVIQSFSSDSGKTWEANWIATFTK